MKRQREVLQYSVFFFFNYLFKFTIYKNIIFYDFGLDMAGAKLTTATAQT